MSLVFRERVMAYSSSNKDQKTNNETLEKQLTMGELFPTGYRGEEGSFLELSIRSTDPKMIESLNKLNLNDEYYIEIRKARK